MNPVLNTADALYLGDIPVDVVFAGTTKVWPKPKVWTPDKLPGLTIWLDASQLGLADGAAVSPWPNLAVGGQPGTMVDDSGFSRWPKISTNKLNGKSIVRFTVSEGRMRMTGTGIELEFTLAYVARMVPGGSYIAGRIVTATYPPTNFLLGYWNGFEDVAYSTSGAFFTPDNRPASTTNWNLYSADGGIPTNWLPRLFKNGVLLNSNPTVAGNRGQDGWLSTFNLGGYDAASSAETCDFEIAEVVMYDHKITDIERDTLEQYLRTKWGL